LLRIRTKTLPARVTTLKHKVDANTLQQRPGRTLGLNEIGFCNLSTRARWRLMPTRHRRTGRLHLVDRFTNATAGAGMIASAAPGDQHPSPEPSVDKAGRAALNHQMPSVLWFTGTVGLPASRPSPTWSRSAARARRPHHDARR